MDNTVGTYTMSRDYFKELFSLEDEDTAMEMFDEQHEDGMSWFEIAKGQISTMNFMLQDNDWKL